MMMIPTRVIRNGMWMAWACAMLSAALVCRAQTSEPAPTTAPAASQSADSQPSTDSAPAAATSPSAGEAASGEAASQPATASAPSSQPTTTSAPATRPVPGGAIMLNFRDASLRSVLEFLSESAGLVIVEDAHVEGRVTVMSRQPVSPAEAVAILDTVLREKGYAAVRSGKTLKIVAADAAKKELIPVRSGADPNAIEPSDRIVTQIIPIRNADAIKLKTDLASLIPASADVTTNASSNTLIMTAPESTIRHIMEVIQAIDVHMSEVSQVKVFQLKYANATSAARLITDIFRDDTTSRGGGGGAAGRGGRQFQGGGGAGGAGGFMAAMMSARGGGGQGAAAQEVGARAVKVTASADDRTNTLVVSASPELLKVIEGVVKDLDANPAMDQAVFIYHLNNGQAGNMAGVLNNIFGTGGSGSLSSGNRQTAGYSANSSALGGNRNAGGGAGGGMRTGGGGGGGTNTGNRGGTTGGSFGGGNRGGMTSAANGTVDLSGQVYVVPDTDTNSLLVQTASKNFERVKGIIKDLDRAVPQVLIKVLIAEVTHDNTVDLGVEFSGMNLYGVQTVTGLNVGNQVQNTAGGAGPPNQATAGRGEIGGPNFGVAAATDGFVFRLDEKYVSAAVHAVEQVAKLDVLSRPYILTADNQQASILIGQSVPLVSNTRTTDTGQTINTVQYQDIGISLQVTPHVNPQGLVTLDVFPEISNLTNQTVNVSDTGSYPVYDKRNAISRVAILDGQTIVIGGLMQDRKTKTISKVPFLGDLPVVGIFFQRTEDSVNKTELLIFLTPHVAKMPDQLQDMSKDELRGAKVVPHAVAEGVFEDHIRGMNRGAASQPSGQDSRLKEDSVYMPSPLDQGAKANGADNDSDE